jgi:ligand-binding SRPBCC domain-containing protein
VIFERITLVRAPLPRVFGFFAEPQNLARITPPSMSFHVVAGPGRAIREGDRLEYRMRFLGVPLRWVSRITVWRENGAFADAQERGPFRRWLHTHLFREVPEGVQLLDRVEYELPLGWAGRWIAGWLVARHLEKVFDYRAEVIRGYFSA